MSTRKLFRSFPKHVADWSVDRVHTDGNHHPEFHRPAQHSAGWHPRTEREDIYWQGRAGKGKHRRQPKHLIPRNKYEHVSYTVVQAAAA